MKPTDQTLRNIISDSMDDFAMAMVNPGSVDVSDHVNDLYNKVEEHFQQSKVNISDESVKKIIDGISEKLPPRLSPEDIERSAEDLWNSDPDKYKRYK